MTRRTFAPLLALTSCLIGLTSFPVAAQNLTPVKVLLDWAWLPYHTTFLVAQDKGYYTQAGLNVDLGPGKGSGSTAQLVGSKATQFGFADGFVVGNSISKGMNIRAVAAIYRRNPTGVIVRADSDIKTPKDLEGKSIAITAGSAQFQQWPAFVKGCGLDAGKIRVVNVDPAGTPPALITGQVPAIAGFVQGQAPSVEIRGNLKTRVFWFADCGVNAVSNSIVVHNDLIKEDPELIRAFVAASLRGFLYGRQNPDEMIAITKKFSPAIDPAIARREAELSWNTWVTPSTAGKPLGWSSEKDWGETVGVLKQYGGVTTPLEAQQIYTNDFIPTGAEFIPPPAEPSKT